MTIYSDGWPANFWRVCRSDCMDLHFKLPDGTALSREIEAGSVDVGTKKMICHVKVPAFSATTGATIRAFFGDGQSRANSTATWDSSFAAVWHCVQSPPSDLLDSAAGAKNLTPANMDATNLITIGAGKGWQFNGSDEYARIGQALISAYPFTIEAIQKHAAGVVDSVVVLSNNTTTTSNLTLYIGSTNLVTGQLYNGTAFSTPGATAIGDGEVMHGAYVGTSSTNRRIYRNGSEDGASTASATVPTGMNNTSLARFERSTTHLYYASSLREVRLSTAARSAAWLLATSRALLSPGTYYTVGAIRPVHAAQRLMMVA